MPAPDKLPADFDFSKQGPPDKLPANFDFGEGQSKTAEQPGYWQELWQQSGIPGLVKGIKEHPAETVANAIGGMFAPLNPNFTQGPQAQAINENWTRSPQSAAAQATLGALALGARPVGEGLVNAGKYTAAAVPAAAPGVLGGLAKAGVGEALAKVPGMELPARFGLQYPALRQVARSIEKGHEAGAAALKPSVATAAEAAAPTTEAAAVTKTPGQLLAEQSGKNWNRLGDATKQSYEKTAQMISRAQANVANQQPSAPYVPRGPEHYGVPAAEAPPTNPTQSAPTVSAQPAPAAAPTPAVPTSMPKVQPIRPEPPAPAAVESEPPQSSAADFVKAKNAQAKADRFVDAINTYNQKHTVKGVEPITSEFLANLDDSGKAALARALQGNGLLTKIDANKFPDTSWPYIVTKLRQAEYR